MFSEDELKWLGEWNEPFNHPVMILALRGPFDIAGGATGAVRHLTEIYEAKPYAGIEPDRFFDFSSERPIIRIRGKEGSRKLIWPETECKAARLENPKNDLLLVLGVEPHLRWKAFSQYIFDIAAEAGVEKILTLGSFASLEPHTRSSGVGGSASNPEVTKELGLNQPTYQGPTGIVGVLSTWAQRGEIPVISLRVAVPDYAASMPSPEATRSLLARLELITGISTEYKRLEGSAQQWRQELDKAMSKNPELAEYVSRLEERIDESDDALPSGEDLSAQIEAYLRQDKGKESG